MKDSALLVGTAALISVGVFILNSLNPTIFPLYYFFIVLGIGLFIVFSRIEFEILSLFSWQIYIGSLIFLILPLLIGQVTRGAVRWIPLGTLTIQPAEIVRPFLLVFWANYIYGRRVNWQNLARLSALAFLPIFLILIQPSLGVSIVTFFGFLGVILASPLPKRYFIFFAVLGLFLTPLGWQVLAPYQKLRIMSFLSPQADPSGAGYNSLQSMVSVGSGGLWGKGLGEGGQTQLLFLPEKHTDFIFASIGEELGFAGAFLVLFLIFFLLWRIVVAVEKAPNPQARAFASGIFWTFFVQTVIHIGMNMGLLPITGVPLPLVSAGGSSFVATMIALGMVVGTYKN